MHPVQVCDELELNRVGSHLELTCSEPSLPTNSQNLVYRAAESFFSAAGIREGVRIHLEKRLPLAAGLGEQDTTVVMTVIERLAAIQVPRGDSGKQSAR